MKLKMPLEDYTGLQRYVEQAVSEYGPALQRVIVSNDVRLKILQANGIDVSKVSIQGIGIITEPFLPEGEVQVVLGQGEAE
jgi:hypothetical protein